MSKNKKQFACAACGSISGKWMGQCPDCMEWGTISEEIISASKIAALKVGNVQEIQSLADEVESTIRTKTPIEELNRVLGGGLVSGSAILIGGDPGIGKSTLLLRLSSSLSQNNIGCLYITGEESINQIKLRGMRLGINDNKTGLLSATNVEDIISTIDKNKQDLDLVVIDSIQTIATSDLSSAPGTVF